MDAVTLPQNCFVYSQEINPELLSSIEYIGVEDGERLTHLPEEWRNGMFTKVWMEKIYRRHDCVETREKNIPSLE